MPGFFTMLDVHFKSRWIGPKLNRIPLPRGGWRVINIHFQGLLNMCSAARLLAGGPSSQFHSLKHTFCCIAKQMLANVSEEDWFAFRAPYLAALAFWTGHGTSFFTFPVFLSVPLKSSEAFISSRQLDWCPLITHPAVVVTDQCEWKYLFNICNYSAQCPSSVFINFLLSL